MPELPVLLFVACAVGVILLLLRREHRILHDDRPHPGVQNHEGDE